ncbi:MAG: thioredoxin-disulfide reductase [Chloroflexi bacterium RBG_16_52_11]|nr:MAG: thioredoxin-disulfide reductase [Chloroflexi bacterium RBG_16_52_11]
MDFSLTNLSTSREEEKKHVKVVIIGSGPAGFSAALYAARADLNPVVLSGMELGGQVSLTYTVENYPGFPEGVGGAELVELFNKQAQRFGAQVEFDSATEVDLSQRPFYVRTYNSEYLADALIISTGATPKHLEIPGESELTGRGVSYCATCDGWFFKEKDVIVVGGGDSAVEEAIFLTRYARSVTIVHRREELRAGTILQNRAKSNPKMKFIWNSVLTDIVGEAAVKAVRIKNLLTGEVTDLKTDGVFIFIGHTPNSQLFHDKLDLDQQGYLIVDMLMQTSVPGVFAAGEIADPTFRQVVTSAGMGAAAAMQAIHFLESQEMEVTNPEYSVAR